MSTRTGPWPEWGQKLPPAHSGPLAGAPELVPGQSGARNCHLPMRGSSAGAPELVSGQRGTRNGPGAPVVVAPELVHGQSGARNGEEEIVSKMIPMIRGERVGFASSTDEPEK